MPDRATVEVSVVIPTIGRPNLLRQALTSVSMCNPGPAEVLIVDQSDGAISSMVDEVDIPGLVVIPCPALGIGHAANDGLRNAKHSIVMITHDDCTVRQDWIAVGLREMERVPEGMLSGRVLPAGGDPRMVPSTITEESPIDYTGDPYRAVLFPNNMACTRNSVLAMGGFDERLVPAAEDNDLAYRWVREGGRLRHVPELVVWHHAWRSLEQLKRVYFGYYRANGMFYAKHLRRGDMRFLIVLAKHFRAALWTVYASLFRGVPRWADRHGPFAGPGAFVGMLSGLLTGWREFGQPK
jgi:GT2 family glycosyltransferase